MRKIIILAAIVLHAVSAGAYVYLFQPFYRQTAVETVLPGDTLGTIRVYELKQQIEDFRAGRLGQALAGIDLPRLMGAMEMPPEQRLKILQLLEECKTTIDSPWFDVLFGQDISLSLLNGPYDLKLKEPNDLQQLRDIVVLVARPRQPTRVLENLNAMFSSQLAVQTQDYKQWEINQITPQDGLTVYYALNQGLMIAGLSAMPVQKCLEQSLDASSSLMQAPAYQRCAALFKRGQTDLLAFVDMKGGMSLLHEIISRNSDSQDDARLLNAQIEHVQGIDTINLAQYDDGGSVVRSKMIVGIDRARMSPLMNQAMGIAPAANPTLKNAPMNALLYSWQNTVDLNYYWQEIQQSPAMTPEATEKIERTIAAKTGMELAAVLKAFGTQAGFLINTINLDGMIPFPELALFVEVVQPDLIDGLIKQQVNQFNMPLQQETYNGTDLHYVALPLGTTLSPAYTISEGFCTIAINRPLLKKMLDAPDTDHLSKNPHFTALNQGLTDKNNSVFYVQSEGLFAATRELIARSFTWMAMAKPDGLEKAKLIVELGINPLLDGLSMLQAAGCRTTMEEDHISSDILVLLDRP